MLFFRAILTSTISKPSLLPIRTNSFLFFVLLFSLTLFRFCSLGNTLFCLRPLVFSHVVPVLFLLLFPSSFLLLLLPNKFHIVLPLVLITLLSIFLFFCLISLLSVKILLSESISLQLILDTIFNIL